LLGKYRSTGLEVPTLMLNGTEDFALSAGDLGSYTPYADDLRVELVTDAGHVPPEERPRLFAEIAVRFVSALIRAVPAERLAELPLSFTRPLRRPGVGPFIPPGQWRLVAQCRSRTRWVTPGGR
jgi:hypothetical protein